MIWYIIGWLILGLIGMCMCIYYDNINRNIDIKYLIEVIFLIFLGPISILMFFECIIRIKWGDNIIFKQRKMK